MLQKVEPEVRMTFEETPYFRYEQKTEGEMYKYALIATQRMCIVQVKKRIIRTGISKNPSQTFVYSLLNTSRKRSGASPAVHRLQKRLKTSTCFASQRHRTGWYMRINGEHAARRQT